MAVTMALTPDSFLLSCGAPSSTTDESDGRLWNTDTHDPNLLPSNFSSISSTATSSDTSITRVPYMSARIFQSPFTYTLPVSPGTKFLRLYFYPSSYLGIRESFFSVTANHFTLLRNFSAFLTVDASTNSSKAIRKEFVINVNGTPTLKITFAPSSNSYAFVNGIEILSIPTNLYIRGDDYDIKLVGQNNLYYIDNKTALETLYRLNVGGNLVPSTGDTGIYRIWAADDKFVTGYDNEALQFDINITYTSETPDYTAPNIVYTSVRALANHSQSLDWIFPLDSGFYYLFRLHFCEIYPGVNKINEMVFDIYIGNQTADRVVDVVALTGGWGTPMYSDYVVYVRDPGVRSSKQNVWLQLRPNMETRPVYVNAFLNGLEIFKLSDPNGNLAVPYPELHFLGPIKSPPNNKKKKILTVVIIAGVISGIVVFSILGYLISRRLNGGKDSGTSVPKSSSLPSDQCRHFIIAEIKNATDNFDEKFVIGYGGFGNVYKGYLDNNTTTVAVKRSNPSSKQGVREFQTEIEMLSSKLRHRHLVSLIGYCDDKNEMILVYDYMANGTLRDHLYNTHNAPLPWKKRLDICIGAAKGLCYLHSGTKHTIIHRDVKSTNILLDDKWVAKVSDFGLSKVGSLGGTDITHVSTAVKGSFGYVDPEYYKRQRLTVKSDVYSFGVVLFEVLCARAAINPNLPSEQVNLAEWACRSCKKREVEQIIDPKLKGQIAPECLSKFAELAYHCLRKEGVQRPSMGDVVKTLEFALQLQEGADNRGHEVEGHIYPPGPSFPLIINGHDANITTNEDEIFSDLSEVERKLTSNGISMSISRSAKLKNVTIFSELVNPLGR